MGSKKRPTYRFVAADSRSPRDGRFLEILGWYNPIEKPARLQVKEEKTYEWLKRGALPSDTVLSLYRQIGLWKKWEMIQKGEDPAAIRVTDRIKERPKRRKGKKAVARAEAAKAEAEKPAEAAVEAAVEAPAKEEVPAKEEAPAEEETKE
jgi:small subunit ribosomal protein S16